MQAAVAAQPDVLSGPYGSGPMLNAARACERVLWNHGGASSRLTRPAFPHIINILLLTRPWRSAAFVDAGVEEVLAPLGQQREGLLGPAQWLQTATIEPDEKAPDASYHVFLEVDLARR